MMLLPVFSKYVLSRIRNLFLIQKKQVMIRIFAEAFDYCNIFSKSKTNIDEDKKDNFRVKIVKEGLVFAAMPCRTLSTIDVSHPGLKL